MGMHYVNPARMGSIDPLRPGILLYAKAGKGVRLVGVEYFKADADQNLGTTPTGPPCSARPSTARCRVTSPDAGALRPARVAVGAQPGRTFAAFNPPSPADRSRALTAADPRLAARRPRRRPAQPLTTQEHRDEHHSDDDGDGTVPAPGRHSTTSAPSSAAR
jgi:hypothetical protein